MKLRILLLLIALLLPIGAIAFGQGQITDAWQIVGEGVEYQKFHFSSPAPVNIFVARLDRGNSNAIIESSIGQGRLTGGAETVGSMAARYDQAVNFWGPPTDPVSPTWGSTNNVIVSINGYFFGPLNEDPGVPWSGQIHSGWYAKRFYNTATNTAGSGFAWRQDRSAFIGGCVSHPTDKQYVDFAEWASEEIQMIDGVNVSRADNKLILYTSQYDRDTNTNGVADSLEVLVEMYEPTLLTAANNVPFGVVRRIRNSQGSTPIPYDHVVLSAHGEAADILAANIQVGDTIGIAQKIKHFMQDQCAQPNPEDWIGTYASIAGSYFFLRNGVIYDFSGEPDAGFRQPRTAIAYNNDYVFFIVADGRNPGVSEGLTIAELADFAKGTLAATYGIAQDGGGSSTMVVNGEVVNNTFCNHFYCSPVIYLPLVVNKSLSGDSPVMHTPQIEWDQENQIIQRLVANGMMMVVVQPMDVSPTPFDPGDPVTTTVQTDVYLGPGTNYAVLNTFFGDGTIKSTLNDLGGVYAKGTYWWKVDFGAIEGWVPEDNIIAQIKFRRSDVFKTR